MKKRFKHLLAIVMLLAILMSVFAGCAKETGESDKDSDNKKPNSSNSEKPNNDKDSDDDEPSTDDSETPEDTDSFPLTGYDVFNGEKFSEMIWGYYEADCYEYNGSNDDSLEFREGMEYITSDGNTLSALPLTIQAGKYTHFMGAFNYEGTYYQPYTEKGKTMFRKAYIAENGDMTEEQFQKAEAIMQLDVVEVTMATEGGGLQSAVFTYKLENNKIALYEVEVDDDLNITMAEEPFVKYDFLHEGNKLTLQYKNVQRSYIAEGLKEADPGFTGGGYALNDTNKYKNLEGFTFYSYGRDDDFSVYVDLSNGDSPVDPVMDFDFETNDITISWEQIWRNTADGLEKIDDPCEIQGKLIPCSSYGFTEYEGFFLIIDGKCYRYLMSEKEYNERLYGDVLGNGTSSDDLGSDTLDEIESTKRNILEELKKAFDAAGIQAEIDLVSGKVALEANFLFSTSSAEVSQEGKDYINRFIDAYTSVVLGDSYAEYISSIIIEGHTDTSGSYMLNQKLSEDRANAVAALCISRSAALESVIQTKGCAYDYPVYNEDGTVNMDKSRRVTFHFVFADI